MIKIETYPSPKSEYQQAEEIVALGDGLPIDATARLAGWMDALRVGAAEIDVRCGMQAGYAFGLRLDPAYREFVRRCVKFFASRVVRQSDGRVTELFNSQIEPSVAALIEVRDNPYSKGGDRVKAAVEFLDRAPDAPKSTKQVDERSVRISIPVSELQNMQRALIEEGGEEELGVARLLASVTGGDAVQGVQRKKDEMIEVEVIR